jgi:hypothetical protein
MAKDDTSRDAPRGAKVAAAAAALPVFVVIFGVIAFAVFRG